MLRPIPICKYDPTPACTYDVMKIVAQNVNDEFVMKFVTGMNDSFESLKSMILVILPLIDIKSAFKMEIYHERQQICSNGMSQVMCIQEIDGKVTQEEL